MPIDVFATRDCALLRSMLRRDPVGAAYLLGDLEEPFFSLCRWYVGSYRQRPQGVVMVFTGAPVPALLSHGAPDAVAAVLGEMGGALPSECDAKIPLEHRDACAARYRFATAENHWNMCLRPGEEPPREDASGVRRLDTADLPALTALYASYPGNYFAPEEMERGLFFGRFAGGCLVAVAATHVVAPSQGVAVLGNLVTAADQRSRGHARACTGRLIDALREMGCATVALQVAADNAPAIACYRRLGFSFHNALLQAHCAAH